MQPSSRRGALLQGLPGAGARPEVGSVTEGCGLLLFPSLCQLPPPPPAFLLPCGCSQVSLPNPFLCHSFPSLQLLIPDRREGEREKG